MTATALPELESALSTSQVEGLDLEAPDLMGAWRAAEDRARIFRGQELAKALVDWANAHLHTDEDRREFLEEIVAVLSEGDFEAFDHTLREWVRTATELADPETREVLLGEHDAADFEDVSRPS